MSDFEQPDFKKDTLKIICRKMWLAFKYEFKHLNNRVSNLEDDHAIEKKMSRTLEKEVASLDGKMKVIIAIGLLTAAGVFAQFLT